MKPLALACLLLIPSTAAARTYTLPELISVTRKTNPGIAAAVQQTAAVQAQLLEARRSWMPTGELLSMVAPAPEIRCLTDLPLPSGTSEKEWRQEHCDRTNVYEASLNLRGVFTRTELRLVQPIYTFGKISAGVSAAESGIAASRSREQGVAAEVEMNVRRAYWTAKLSREILETINEGVSYLDEGQKTVEKDLAEGGGNATPADRYRLITVRADVDSRVLEATKLAQMARGGIRALIGPEAPKDIDVDSEPLAPLEVPPRTLEQYEDQAQRDRPEVRALGFLVEAKRSLADLERRKQYPDLVLMGTATFAFTSSIDNPKNAFANDPYNALSGGLAAAVRMPLDLGVKNARAVRLNAEAEEAFQRHREARGGITFEVQRAHADMIEAQQRMKVLKGGEKAGRTWMTSISQKFALGLAETKDLSDALVAYFQFRVRYLQAVYDFNIAAAALGRAIGGDVANSNP